MQHILKKIARQNDVSLEEVKAEIAMAIQIGMGSADAQVQQRWNEVPKAQDVPSVEEVIAFVAARILETEQADCTTALPDAYELATK